MRWRDLPFALLVLFAFLTPAIAPAYIAFGFLLLAWVISLRRERRFPESLRSPFVFAVGLLGILTAVSTLFSRNPAVSARHVGGGSLLLLVPIAMDLTDALPRARAIVLALSVSGGLLSLLGIWQYFHGGDELDHRIRGTLSHYMTFSGLTLISGCLLLGFALEQRGRWRWIGLCAAVPLLAVLLTFTRGAYLGILAAVLLLAAVRRPRGLLWLAPVLVAVFFLAPAGIRGRIRSITDLSDRTSRDRIAMVHAGARMVADAPIFGLGPDMVQPYYALYRDPDAPRWRVPHLHNNAVQIAAANGLFAAAAYALVVAMFLARTIVILRRERRPEAAAIWTGVLLAGAALSVAGLFEYNFGDTEVEMATLLLFALPFSKAVPPAAPLESR